MDFRFIKKRMARPLAPRKNSNVKSPNEKSAKLQTGPDIEPAAGIWY